MSNSAICHDHLRKRNAFHVSSLLHNHVRATSSSFSGCAWLCCYYLFLQFLMVHRLCLWSIAPFLSLRSLMLWSPISTLVRHLVGAAVAFSEEPETGAPGEMALGAPQENRPGSLAAALPGAETSALKRTGSAKKLRWRRGSSCQCRQWIGRTWLNKAAPQPANGKNRRNNGSHRDQLQEPIFQRKPGFYSLRRQLFLPKVALDHPTGLDL